MQIIDFILCEDIRFEEGGQRSFIGVIEDNFILKSPPEEDDEWPKIVSMAIALRATVENEDQIKKPASFEVLFKFDDSYKSVGEQKLPEDKINNAERKISLGIVLKRFPIEKPARFSVKVILKNSEKEEIASAESPAAYQFIHEPFKGKRI